jgi:hypothetical protein
VIGGLDTSRHDQAANPSSNLKTKPSNHSVGQISATSTEANTNSISPKKTVNLGARPKKQKDVIPA